VIKDIEMQLPQELKINYIKRNGVLKPFKRLISMKKNEDYNKSDDINEEFLGISNIDDLERLLSFEYFKDILTNRYFIKSAKTLRICRYY
jgi:hypothetical protein